MAINVNNGLIGLSILGGTSAYGSMSSSLTSTDSPAVIKAKKAFTLPATTPPWDEDEPEWTSSSSEITAIKKLLTIIDTGANSDLEDLPDVEAAFTIYKALDKLKTLAESAASSSTSATERAALSKVFEKGLADLEKYMGSAQTDLLKLSFGVGGSRAQTIAVDASNVTASVVGKGVAGSATEALSGLTGNEVFELTLKKGATTETVTVDLSQSSTQPPTLQSVADALNAAIRATPATDANGDPVLDEDGNAVSFWKSNFAVKYDGEKWGLVFNPSGIETTTIDQVGSGDALMVAAGETRRSANTDAGVYRITDPEGGLDWERLGKINGVDAAATEQAKLAGTAKDKDDKKDDKNRDYTVGADTEAAAMVTDADGYGYIVGTTDGNVGTNLSDGKDDLFLTKVDSEGKIVWQRSLGAAGSAEGAAVTISASGEIVVAGTVSGAYNGGDDGQTDILVARFSTKGEELSSTAIRQIGNESASAVTVGDDGSIYVAGRASTGGGDAFVAKLSATGVLQERRTIDSGGSDLITDLAIDGSGNLLALVREGGSTTLRQIDSTALSNDLGSIALGTVDARAIAVSDTGEIAVVGATSSAVAGTQVNAIGGSRDGFVTVIDAGLTSARTTYVGTAEDDQADSIAWLNGKLYVGGRTTGTLEGTRAGMTDGFVARIDAGTGTLENVSQFGLAATTFEPVQVTAVSGGDTALGALGLGRGTLNQQSSATLVSQSSLRVGDEFTIKVNDGATRTITIEANETMSSLSRKISRITGTTATVRTAMVDGQTSIRIAAAADQTIELGAGADGKDALYKLGLSPVRLASTTKSTDKNAPAVTPGGSYSLALSDAISLTSEKGASVAVNKVTSAISMIQTAYRSLYWDATKTAKVDGTLLSGGGGSAYQQARLASYQAALSRLA